MAQKFSKNYIKSTCREIARKRERGHKMRSEGKELVEHADALQKMLIDAGIPESEINDALLSPETKKVAKAA